jgi:hypothetical protein
MRACNVDGFVKSLNSMSFRAEREILAIYHDENTRFLLAVEMTDSTNTSFCEFVKVYGAYHDKPKKLNEHKNSYEGILK